jgi:hypothetical protein
MKLGSVGFLMNHYHGDMLLRRLHAAEPAVCGRWRCTRPPRAALR